MAGLKFEQALKRLEEIVEELEKGNLSLDESLKRYEEGIKLSRFCTKKLEETERKVELLTKNEKGEFEKTPYEEKGEPAAKSRKSRKKKKKADDEGFLFEEDK
ncbi:MAG: exodeoxyribonuclease VII small subunit [Candidatus Omnitrophica bacterium]|nr:exodeoxyribonuclease VII small subunit [Candidatus Omnitrophota bacterium]